MALGDLVEHRRDLAAVRALEVGELDDGDRRAVGALASASRRSGRSSPVGIEAALVALLDLLARHPVLDAAEDVLRGGQALGAGALLVHALGEIGTGTFWQGERNSETYCPHSFFSRGVSGARVDPLEGHLGGGRRLLLRRRPRRSTCHRSTPETPRGKSPMIPSVNALIAHASGRRAYHRAAEGEVGAGGLLRRQARRTGSWLCAPGPHAARHHPTLRSVVFRFEDITALLRRARRCAGLACAPRRRDRLATASGSSRSSRSDRAGARPPRPRAASARPATRTSRSSAATGTGSSRSSPREASTCVPRARGPASVGRVPAAADVAANPTPADAAGEHAASALARTRATRPRRACSSRAAFRSPRACCSSTTTRRCATRSGAMLADIGLVVDAVRRRRAGARADGRNGVRRARPRLSRARHRAARFRRDVRDDPRHAALPVLILSQRRSSRDVVDAFASGADDFLPKPFRAPELGARIFGLFVGRSRVSAVAPYRSTPGGPRSSRGGGGVP